MAIGDALVRGPAVRAGVAAVFDERYFGVVPAENRVVGRVHRSIEPVTEIFVCLRHPRSAFMYCSPSCP